MTKPIPKGYHALTPSIAVDNAAKAIEFYKRAFGAKERVRMDTRERSVASSSDGTWKAAGMRSAEGAAVLQQIEAEQRLGERRAGGVPALARVERAGARLPDGRV